MARTILITMAALAVIQTTFSNPQTSPSQPKQPAVADQLRASIIASASAPEGEEDVRFGPLKDGRRIFLTVQMVNGSRLIHTSYTGVGDHFNMLAGRTSYVKSAYLIDAMIVCGHSSGQICNRPVLGCDGQRQNCSKIGVYTKRVAEATSPDNVPLIEEMLPDLNSLAQSARADRQLYWASLTGAVQSLAVMIQLHEIGHAAFHHLDNPSRDPKVQIVQEGEADGFASYVAELSDSPAGGIAAILLLDSIEESLGPEGLVTAHPPALCRDMQMTMKSSDWIQRNQSKLQAPSGNEARDRYVTDTLQQLASKTQLRRLDPALSAACKPYMDSFAAGFARAATLVDKNTDADFTIPGPK